MIEHSLNTVRNLHRLILAVAFLTLVFSLSLSLPIHKQQHLNQIQSLISFDYNAYDEYVKLKVNEYTSEQYAALEREVASSIKNVDHLIFNVDKIPKSFGYSPHVGKIIVKDLIISNPTNATLNSFNAINGLPIGKDVQVIIPKIDEVMPIINGFFSENSRGC